MYMSCFKHVYWPATATFCHKLPWCLMCFNSAPNLPSALIYCWCLQPVVILALCQLGGSSCLKSAIIISADYPLLIKDHQKKKKKKAENYFHQDGRTTEFPIGIPKIFLPTCFYCFIAFIHVWLLISCCLAWCQTLEGCYMAAVTG